MCRAASRDDFTFDKERNLYTCPAGKALTTTGSLVNDGETLLDMASMRHCRSCPLKAQCCPKAPFRRVPRSIYEEARDVARTLAKTEAFERSRHTRAGSASGKVPELLCEAALKCMSSEHLGQLAWQFKRMSGSSGLRVQAAIAC
jgi:hypothetical protein